MNKWVEIGLYSTAAALLSGLASHYFTKKYILKAQDEIIQDEVAQIKAHYHKVIEDSKVQMRNEAEKDVMETVLTHLGYASVEEAEQEIKELENDELALQEQENFVDPEDLSDAAPSDPRIANIWDTPQLSREEYLNGVGDDPEDEEELAEDEFIPRGAIVTEPDYPFTITRDDYFDDEPDYDKLTLTYYVADDILADTRDEIVDDVEGTIGPDALESFGHISGDPNICYVRNRERDADFEIVRDERSYSVVIHGMDPEDLGLKKAKERPKKMRDDE